MSTATTTLGPVLPDDEVERASADEPATAWRTSSAIAIALGAAVAALSASGTAPGWAALRMAVVGATTYGAVWCLRRAADRRVRAAIALALGIAGLTVGLGIGMPHAVKDGLTVTSTLGILSLVAALALVGVGTASLVRRARIWWRVPAAVALVAVTVLVTAPLTLAFLVTNSPRSELSGETPATYALAYEDVRLTATDGVELAAWYVPSTNGAAVVLLHGAGSNRSSELDHAAALATHGYGVLLLDARGQGESDGDAMLWGWYGTRDVEPAVDFLAARTDVLDGRIGVVGMSMGAEQAINAGGADARIRAIVAEGASGQRPANEGADMSGIGGLLPRYVDWVGVHATELITSAPRPPALADSLATMAPRPAFVIAAGDVTMEQDAARAFTEAAPRSVEVWVAADAGHTAAYDVHPDEWTARVTTFLDRSLA
jgi:uncharacterized protein